MTRYLRACRGSLWSDGWVFGCQDLEVGGEKYSKTLYVIYVVPNNQILCITRERNVPGIAQLLVNTV